MPRIDRKDALSDPLRRLWAAYTGFVTIEGLLLVLGLSGMIAFINGFLIYQGGTGLGYLVYLLGLGVAYLAVIGVMRPLSVWKRAHRLPGEKKLPSTLKIVIPALRDCGGSAEEMRRIVAGRSSFSLFDKRRFYRNLVVFILGLAGFVAIFLL